MANFGAEILIPAQPQPTIPAGTQMYKLAVYDLGRPGQPPALTTWTDAQATAAHLPSQFGGPYIVQPGATGQLGTANSGLATFALGSPGPGVVVVQDTWFT